jgi:hypothetical protein
VTAVEGWVRLSSKRIQAELHDVKRGKFKIEDYAYLLTGEAGTDGEDDGPARS